jgi:hypothetical protein
MIICSYGCGNEAKYFFKSGKGCCSESVNSCPNKRMKDSINKKGKPFSGKRYWEIPSCEYKSWNTGLTKQNNNKLLEIGKKVSVKLKGKVTGKAKTPEIELLRKQKISETMKKNPNSGGVRKGSGRGNKGWYNGFWCDSSWELAWVIYHIDHKINFERNQIGFEYDFLGKKLRYYPDFKIGDIFYEIKGRRTYETLDNQTKEKINQFQLTLIVIYEKEMKPILDYVVKTYGKDFIKLYQK